MKVTFNSLLMNIRGTQLVKKEKKITRDANNIHIREITLKEIKNILNPFGNHVHSHGISRTTGKSKINILSRNRALNALKPAKST